MVDVFPPYGPAAKVPPKPGGKNVKLQVAGGVCVDTGLIIERVV